MTMQLINTIHRSTQVMEQFMAWMEDYGEALDPDSMAEVEGAIAAAQSDLSTAVDQIVGFAEALQADLAAAKARKQSLVESCDRRIASIEGQLEALQSMWLRFAQCGIVGDRTVGQLDAIAIRTSQSVAIYDEDRLPSEFVREEVVRRPDKRKISDAIAQGATVPGARMSDRRTVKFGAASQRDRARRAIQ